MGFNNLEVFAVGLTLIFVVAKLWGKISWPWWLVFAPIWIYVLGIVFILFIIALVLLLAYWFNR